MKKSSHKRYIVYLKELSYFWTIPSIGGFEHCWLNKWGALGRNELPFGRLNLGHRFIYSVVRTRQFQNAARPLTGWMSTCWSRRCVLSWGGRVFTVLGTESSTCSCCWEKVVQAFLMNEVHRRSDDLDSVGATASFHFSLFSIHPRTTACSSAVRWDFTQTREAAAWRGGGRDDHDFPW